MTDHSAESIYMQGYVAAIRDVRKMMWDIMRLKKPFEFSKVDGAVKDLIKLLDKENENAKGDC